MKLVHWLLMSGLLHLVQRGGTGQSRSPPRQLLAVPDVTDHPSTASVQITVLLYNDPLLCGFNVLNKGLRKLNKLWENLRDVRPLSSINFFFAGGVSNDYKVFHKHYCSFTYQESIRKVTSLRMSKRRCTVGWLVCWLVVFNGTKRLYRAMRKLKKVC